MSWHERRTASPPPQGEGDHAKHGGGGERANADRWPAHPLHRLRRSPSPCGGGDNAARLALAAALTLTLSACFTPLYGPTASGERLDAVMAAIEVQKIESPAAFERLTHYLRSELVFDLNGTGQPVSPRYTLALAYDQQVTAPIIDATTGRAQAAAVIGEVTYALKDFDGRTLAEGKAVSSASYDRSSQRFATVRAARDADIRLAKVLSEQIKVQLASALKTGV